MVPIDVFCETVIADHVAPAAPLCDFSGGDLVFGVNCKNVFLRANWRLSDDA